MNGRELLGEVRRNLRTGTTRAVLFALALAAVTGTLAVADARTIVGLHQRAAAFVASGASVRVLDVAGSVDGGACDALAQVTGVAASGALAEDGSLVLSSMPDNPVPAYRVTPGLAAVLGVRAESTSGVWVSARTAETLGADPGQVLDTTDGPMTLAGVFDYPDDGRDSRLGYAVLLPEPAAGSFDQCWADTRPPTEKADELLRWAVRPGADPSLSVTLGQLNTSLGTTFDGAAAFGERPTRFAAPAAALAGLVLGFVAVWLRRLELAGALHVGVSRRVLLAGTVLETSVWALAGLVLAVCALVVAAHVGNPADPWDAVAVDVRGPAAAVLTALFGASVAVFLVRERHLFRYFKDR
ncbi:hypothetical protein [Nocardiopsis halotolerans]|uniref:hypothetical protein n=1 Tax=Nocardiopsis halotolerans TaxID=124252 RepID=UPI00034AFCB5|nr:hypothetical protein [Nocardiopsis halotolerans]